MEISTQFTHSEGSFVNARGHKLYTQTYTPSGEPRGVILYIPGLGDYSGRYVEFFKFIVDRGFVVHAFDFQSHGKSEGPTGYIHHFNDVLEDTEQFALLTKQISPRLPHVAIGYSLGGLAAVHISMKRPNIFDGVVLLAPSNRRPPFVSPALVWSLSWIAPWVPGLRVRPLDVSTMLRDKKHLAAYVADPLIWHCKLPLLFSYSIIESGTEMVENADSFHKPYLLLQGTADQIVSVEGNTEFHRRTRSTDKTCIMMHGLYHELLHEPEYQDIQEMIGKWLDERMPGDPNQLGFVALEKNGTQYLQNDGKGNLVGWK